MVRMPRFFRPDRRRRPTGVDPQPTAVPGVRSIGPELALGAGFLIETGTDGLRLHVPAVTLPTDELLGVAVVPGDRGPELGYRRPSDRGPVDLCWSRGFIGGFGDGPLKDELAANATTRRPFDDQLVRAGFEPVSPGIWRYPGDGAVFAVLLNGELNFYGSRTKESIDEVVRTSQVHGVERGHGTDYLGQPQEWLRLSNDWMSYRIDVLGAYLHDAEMSRAVTRAELNLHDVPPPRAEPSGFLVDGENPTEVIRGLTELNRRPVAKLEAWMRPFDFDHPSEPVDFQRSEAGFLGPRDSLVQTLVRDNEVVRRLGLTHAELGEQVHMAAVASAVFGVRDYVGPGEHRYRIDERGSMGIQVSPFFDGYVGSRDYTLSNKATGESVGLSDLAVSMINRYGFYQGPGTPYRSSPEAIIRTFTHLTEKAGGPDRIAEVVREVDAQLAATDAIARATAPAERQASAPTVADPDRPAGGGRPARTLGKQGPDGHGR